MDIGFGKCMEKALVTERLRGLFRFRFDTISAMRSLADCMGMCQKYAL